MAIDEQGDGWNPHDGLRVPEIPNLRCDLLLRSGDVVDQEDSYDYWSYWHWAHGDNNPNEIIAFRLVP